MARRGAPAAWLRDKAIGALNLFGTVQAHFDEADTRVVQSLADIATIALLQECAVLEAERLAEQLQLALNSRIVVEQAKGALAQLEGCSVEEAFALMRDSARSSRRRLVDVARDVLATPGA
ncbi:ANTAR domain-containing protein [Nocardioides sp. SYSU DS0663]|uniref:ANTAR domain-containing protein n=1 Tax=Nocardioides sp. SYSU DS0663 TaxID=3416445 RepID=UPI003F4C276C